MALTVAVELPAEHREVLESWTRASTMTAGLVQRARIVLLAGDGLGTGDRDPHGSVKADGHPVEAPRRRGWDRFVGRTAEVGAPEGPR